MSMLERFLEIYRKPSISQKLILSYLFLGITITLSISFFFYKTSEKAIIERTLHQLTSIKVLKKRWLEDFFENQQRNIAIMASQKSAVTSFSEINKANQQYGLESPEYKKAIFLFGDILLQYKQNQQLLNVWLCNTNGDIIYESVNESLTGINFLKSPHVNSGFALCCREGLREIFLKDISSLSVHKSDPFILLSAPLGDISGERLGALLVKIDMQKVNNILAQRTGMGTTGESYIVGKDLIMRSKSRFYDSGKQISVDTRASRKAFGAHSGEEILKDYRNVDVLSSFEKLAIKGLDWVLISEMDVSEAMEPIYAIRQRVIVIILFVSIFTILVTLYLSQKIARPIRTLNWFLNALSQGILPPERIPLLKDNEDEIGQMVIAINKLASGLKKTSLFASEIGKGNFSSSFSPLSEQDALGQSLLDMRKQLISLSGIVEKQNKVKTLALIEGQENERRRISMELHDGVGQMLTALKFKIQEIKSDPEILKELKSLLDETIQEVRRVSVNLMPSVLWDFGLEAALNILIKTTNLHVDFDYFKYGIVKEPDMETRICLYRIAQESFQNIQKYAGQKEVKMKIDHSETSLSMTIKDYGDGFDFDKYKSENKASHGLRNMKERVALLGGSFQLKTAPGKGTQVLVSIPF